MKFIAIIPARYASTRFPGKPLADIQGKPMIQHVYERTSQVFEHCCVATDDTRIAEAVDRFGGCAVMTSPDHRSGTDRCAEALDKYSKTTGTAFDAVHQRTRRRAFHLDRTPDEACAMPWTSREPKSPPSPTP